MKHLVLIFLFSVTSHCIAADPIACHVDVAAQEHAKMNIDLLVVGNASTQLQEIANHIKKALEFSNQFAVSYQSLSHVPKKSDISNRWSKQIPYVLFLEQSGNSFGWRLYDTYQADMIAGKKIHTKGSQGRGIAYAMADAIWEYLTGNEGIFSTKIAFCKEIPHGTKSYKHVYIADYDGSHARALVTTPTINVAPRWNKDSNRPLLFYSENTNKNMRMMAVDMNKKKIMASNFDGLNMQPTFSADGRTVVYCASRGNGNTQLYYWRNHQLKKITNNEGNSIFPSLSDDGTTLFFCSDFESKTPKIYEYDLKTEKMHKITESGFCVSPSYCSKTNMLAYCKMVEGKMQLFTYNRSTKEHVQLTKDSASKEECMWSPCGTYLLCEIKNGDKSTIGLYNTITQTYKILADEGGCCSYPSWSGRYNEYPA